MASKRSSIGCRTLHEEEIEEGRVLRYPIERKDEATRGRRGAGQWETLSRGAIQWERLSRSVDRVVRGVESARE